MKKTSAQTLARVVRVLILIVFVCNLIALLLVPCIAVLAAVWNPEIKYLNDAVHYYFGGYSLAELPRFIMDLWVAVWVLTRQDLYVVVLMIFLWVCGICTAVILWQGKRVLDSVMKEDTFSFANAVNMKRASVCCFVISGAALVRAVWGLCAYRNIGTLLTYNSLFVPVFLIAGLICLVMSALFRQAAELKAENDLTI